MSQAFFIMFLFLNFIGKSTYFFTTIVLISTCISLSAVRFLESHFWKSSYFNSLGNPSTALSIALIKGLGELIM